MVGSGDLLGLVCFVLLLHLGVTSPLLTLRNNWAGIPCGNALQIIAGNYLPPQAEDPSSFPIVSTSESQYKYLWCTAGSTTYTFFGTTLPGYGNRVQAIINDNNYIQTQITAHGDGPIPNGWQTYQDNNTNIKIYAEERGATNLTWGILADSLQGLKSWMMYYGSMDMTFQINNGSDKVGAGYIGSLDSKGQCQFSYIPAPCAISDNGS